MVAAEELKLIYEKYPSGQREYLIPILQEAQDRLGYLSQETMQDIGRQLSLPVSKVYGVASFYNQFRFEKQGQCHIQVCRGTACHVKGSKKVLDAITKELKTEPGHTTRDGKFSLEVVACIGACGLSPVITLNGEFHAGVTPDSVKKLIRKESRKIEASNGHGN